MNGHGRPLRIRRSSSAHLVLLWSFACAILFLDLAAPRGFVLSVLGKPTFGQTQTLSDNFSAKRTGGIPPCRFRVSWGGGQNCAWQGTVTTRDAELADVKPLGLGRDSNTTAIATDQNTIRIRQLSAANYDGFDFAINGKSDSAIEFAMSSQETGEIQWQRSTTIAELLSQSINEPLDDFQHGISINRVPGDEILCRLDRDHLVLSPDEKFNVGLRLNRTEIKSTSVNGRLMMTPARENTPTLWTETIRFTADETGSSDETSVAISAPSTEGVYDIVIELSKDRHSGGRGFSSNLINNGASLLGSGKPSITRRIQLVVLDSDRRPQPALNQLTPIQKTTPEQITAPAPRRFPGIKSPPQILGSSPAELVSNAQGQSRFQLTGSQWQAIPFEVNVPGTPHVIEIEYENDQPMTVGLSVLDFDPNGQVPIQGADSGISVPKSITGQMESVFTNDEEETSSPSTHRITFWPRSEQCYFLIANQSPSDSVRLGNITVSSVSSGDENLAPRPTDMTGRRKRLAFCEAANFARGLNVEKFFDLSVGQPLDDWLVFYEGAIRLVQYLKSHHYQGAIIPVVVDGSALYPSQLFSPTPKYDSGTFESLGQDPIRKDVMRLLLELFKREQLTLVPALEFSSPIKDIERSRQERLVNQTEVSYELVDFSGRVQRTDDSAMPRYNPLSPVVQGHAIQIVQELATRYAGHPALGGIAVVCRPDSWTILPGRQGGYDAVTLARFYQELPQSPPVPNNYDEIQNQIFGEYAEQWIQWRADQMTFFYAEMATVIRKKIPNGRLLLAPIELHKNEEISSLLSPNLHSSVNVGQLIRRLGFDRQRLQEEAGIVLLKPELISPSASLAGSRVSENMRFLPAFQEYFAPPKAETGSLTWHGGSWAHFAQLQTSAPFSQQTGRLIRHHQLTPSGPWTRVSLASAIFHQDCSWLIDGGDSLVMGQETAIENFMRVYEQLPMQRFDDLPCSPISQTAPRSSATPALESKAPTAGCPVAVRTLNSGEDSFLYCVNDSPWPTKVRVYFQQNNQTIEGPANDVIDASDLLSQFTPFSELAVLAGTSSNGSPYFELTLPAYELYGGKFSSESALATHFEISVDERIHDVLRKKIYQLQAKLNLASKASPLNVLTNDEFEIHDQASLAGWDFGDQTIENVSLETLDGYQSRSALQLKSDGPSNWVRSNRFDPPVTGRISVTVWIKSLSDQQPPLRLAIEGQTRQSTYYRFGAIGALASDENVNQIDQQWRRFAVHFDDLPTDELVDLRVGFDLMGSGDVLIDRVRVYDRWFDEKDAKAMTQLLASAVPMLRDSTTYESCRRIVEGYWSRFLDEYTKQPAVTNDRNDDPTTVSDLPSKPSISKDAVEPEPSLNRQSNGDEVFKTQADDRADSPSFHLKESNESETQPRSGTSLLRRWRNNLQRRR